MSGRRYEQNCPIAVGLDLLGERWTLLILRELLGGPRRYGDLREELPRIATNLLAQRLRELHDAGLVERVELAPPAARTIYQLTDRAWHEIPPILQTLARFGLSRLPALDGADPLPPLTGFLAGILLAFDPSRAGTLDATYEIRIADRVFQFAVRDGHLARAAGETQLRLTASAADLVEMRLATDAQARSAVASRFTVEGTARARSRFSNLFSLPLPEPSQSASDLQD
ncbi:MAG: transcriptional regulatory protein [Actinomycetia bacterium]|nr:transcriptional regulatory protein [Actinomycetes bacterium]